MLARPTPAEPSLVPTPPVSGRSTGSNLRRASGSGDANGTGYAKQQLRSTRSVSEASTGRTKAEHVEGNIQLCDVIEGDSEVMCVRYSPDGSVLAAGFSDGMIKIYSAMEAGSPSKCLYALNCDDMTAVKLPVTSLRFVPYSVNDEKIEHRHILAASYASGHVRFWHYSSGTCLQSIDESRSQTMSLAFSPLGDQFVTVGSDPQVFLYDIETKKRLAVLDATDSRDKMDGHRARVFAVVYHPNEPHYVLSGGWDDTVQYWDDRQRHAVKKFYGPHICGDALDIDPIYGHILTGSWRKDNPLQIWDFASAEKIKDVPQDIQNTSQLYCAQWLSRDSMVCGGCFNNMARVIDRGTLNTVGQLVQLPQGVYCMDNDRLGTKPQLAVGAANKIYQLKSTLPSNK